MLLAYSKIVSEFYDSTKIDISKFVSIEEFLDRMDKYLDYLKNSGKPGEVVAIPGEHRYVTKGNFLINGIPVPEKVIDVF